MDTDHRACSTHCCVYHGCKYGHADCPVCSAEIVQVYPCEDCDDDITLAIVHYLDQKIASIPLTQVDRLAEIIQIKSFVVSNIRGEHYDQV